MSMAPVMQLHLFFATENDSALILRRSGIKLYNLIAWNRADDSFVEGQWIKKTIRPEACDLSPDGTHFIYAVSGADPNTRASAHYTCISRPPWFTALALYPQHYGWHEGGRFLDNMLYRIHGDAACANIFDDIPDLHRVIQGDETKECRTGLRLENGQPAPLGKDLRDRLLAGAPPKRDDEMSRYETQAGCLYRLDGMDRILIRDFTDMEPRFEPAPYSIAGREPEAWHPLDQEKPR